MSNVRVGEGEDLEANVAGRLIQSLHGELGDALNGVPPSLQAFNKRVGRRAPNQASALAHQRGRFGGNVLGVDVLNWDELSNNLVRDVVPAGPSPV